MGVRGVGLLEHRFVYVHEKIYVYVCNGNERIQFSKMGFRQIDRSRLVKCVMTLEFKWVLFIYMYKQNCKF